MAPQPRDYGFATDDILPPPPEGAERILHDREYRIEAYRLSPDRLLIQGALRDQKPPGLFIPGDTKPLTIHHMMLSMVVAMPSAEIVEVTTDFASHPSEGCPSIIDHYDKLVGLSIARGFTHKVRELFGGPRGCSHTTALLQAMAPIVMQNYKGMQVAGAMDAGEPNPLMNSSAQRQDESWKLLINTCHVWSEEGETVQLLKKGEHSGRRPITMRERLEELGIEAD